VVLRASLGDPHIGGLFLMLPPTASEPNGATPIRTNQTSGEGRTALISARPGPRGVVP
jgi:hypothetical protein